MANFKKHLEVGAIVGTITGVVLYFIQYFREKRKNPNHRFVWCEFLQAILAACAFGAITGIAADKIEPASHPNHRGFFHSYCFWIISGIAVLNIFRNRENKIIWNNLAVIGFAGYSSHLMLDMMTPKSLPMFGV